MHISTLCITIPVVKLVLTISVDGHFTFADYLCLIMFHRVAADGTIPAHTGLEDSAERGLDN